ncbi:hypothetical protein HanRHA438_Chr10g0442761 [Helianthus annuus]|nr:hypothetical protein HanRHA438_Chr10g0442761 [Helianthus annuus]
MFSVRLKGVGRPPLPKKPQVAPHTTPHRRSLGVHLQGVSHKSPKPQLFLFHQPIKNLTFSKPHFFKQPITTLYWAS